MGADERSAAEPWASFLFAFESLGTQVATELALGFFYVAFVFAIEQHPHRADDGRTSVPGEDPTWPVFALFVAGLFLYFNFVPVWVHQSYEDAWLPTSLLYLTLDVYLTVHLLLLYREGESPQWRAIYALLAFTTAVFSYNDLVNVLHYSRGTTRSWGVADALVWHLPYIALVLTARISPRSSQRDPSPLRGEQVEAELTSLEQTLVVTVLFPAIHFAAYGLGLLDEPSKGMREGLMLVWLILVGAVAIVQQQLLASRHRSLAAGTARLSREVASERLAGSKRERLIAQLESKKAEIAAKNAELEAFTYTVSHDLKSPLVTIQGFLGYLADSLARRDVERARQDLERIEAAAARMNTLLDELLWLSRAGRPLGTSRLVPLSDLFGEAAALVHGVAAQRGVEIRVPSDLPTVFADRERLLQVAQNLLQNAVKFLGDEPDPRVEVGVRDKGELVVFVRDNGVGIEPQFHEKVFGIFEQLGSSEAGMGIGLALVKRVVELHGGRAWVESEGRFRGTTMCFTVPGRPADERAEPSLDESPLA